MPQTVEPVTHPSTRYSSFLGFFLEPPDSDLGDDPESDLEDEPESAFALESLFVPESLFESESFEPESLFFLSASADFLYDSLR